MTSEPDKPHLDCREVLEEVYLYLDQECSEVRRDVIKDHLEDCSPCLSEYGIEQEVRTIVHRCCSNEKAPDDVKERLRQKLSAIEQVSELFSEVAERDR
ncbi:mycothiol system anti-sigma-R factor [Glycomyces terrestris]|uniref:Mycothiol system anti-sigma-R factor n=1 Tax=Glycomyces terrestris TaxID=2493553 RepID=A0A426V5A5_9ACTN|nr:mycothiol system anti-sigma-R factor [Glycomyces terrestris]RRS02089.1 mycothiol system anti-sigma-R factor [Glycomyces terrestris]